jgi:Na+-driven multidrug efflux pump
MIRTQSMLRNVGSNWVMTMATIAVTYVTTPFIIRTLGSEGYGTWTLITAMTGYLGLLALGVPMACVRYLAQYLAEGDQRKTNQTIGSCAGLYLMVGICALFVGGVLLVLFSIYNIPSALRHEARLAFAVMVIWVSASFIGFLPEGIMFAHHDFVLRNVVRIGGVLVRMGLDQAPDPGSVGVGARSRATALLRVRLRAFSICLIRRRYSGSSHPADRLRVGHGAAHIFSFSMRAAAERRRAFGPRPTRSSSGHFSASARFRTTPSPTA